MLKSSRILQTKVPKLFLSTWPSSISHRERLSLLDISISSVFLTSFMRAKISSSWMRNFVKIQKLNCVLGEVRDVMH